MGLAAIDLHSQNFMCRPSFTKSSSLVQIDPIVCMIEPFENVKIYKEILKCMTGHTFLC